MEAVIFYRLLIYDRHKVDTCINVSVGKAQLPPTARMYDYIETRWQEVNETYVKTKRHDNLEVSFKEIASKYLP